MKKIVKFLKIAFVVSVGFSIVVIWGARGLIGNAAKGRTYSDVVQIPHRGVGLVLGCSEFLPDGRSNLFFAYRIQAATLLYQHQKVDAIIVSGDNHRVGYDEPSDMKSALVRNGIPEDRIFCDYAGFRTLDSVVRAKAVFGQTNITVISQKFHNQRAIYIAKHKGIDAIGFNARDVNARHSFRTKIREHFARVKTVLDVAFGIHPRFYGERIMMPSYSLPY